MRVRAVLVGVVATLCCGFKIAEWEDGSAQFSVAGWNELESAYVSKGRTCHDGLTWNPCITLSDFRVKDVTVPVYVGYWGQFSLSETDLYPLETPGKWIEADPFAGIEWTRYLPWEEYVRIKTWCLRWHFPATDRQPMDMCAIDIVGKTFLRPSTSWRYRYHGTTEGRVEIRFGCGEDYVFAEDFRLFSSLNAWLIDYTLEDDSKESGLSSGDLTGGVGWKWLYVKAVYWFPFDRRVLSDRTETYGYDKELVLAAGFKFAF